MLLRPKFHVTKTQIAMKNNEKLTIIDGYFIY